MLRPIVLAVLPSFATNTYPVAPLSLPGLYRTASNAALQRNGQTHSAGLSWKIGETILLSEGMPNVQTYSGDPSGITNLDIGQRNAGLDPLYGHVRSLEIGKNALSVEELGAVLTRTNDLVVIGGGQSLMVGHFNSQESSADSGRQTFLSLSGATKTEQNIIFVNGATGGSAAVKASAPSNYWWDPDTATRGPAFDTFYENIAEAGIFPTAILWAQGEADASSIGLGVSRETYKAALVSIFADMRSQLGNIPVFIQRVGRRTSFFNTGGVQEIRDVQRELIAETSWIYEASEVYDQDLYDDVHPDDAGYIAIATRNARKILSVFGETLSGVDGPEIVSASLNASTVTVTLSHDAGSDFTPTTAIEGFFVAEDGSEIAINSAVRTSATTITLTLASAPTGSVVLYYGYDSMSSLNPAKIVTDNASTPMPLRTGCYVLSSS